MKILRLFKPKTNFQQIIENTNLNPKKEKGEVERLNNEGGRFFAGLANTQPDAYFNTQNIYRF